MRIALFGSRQLEQKQEYFKDIKLCYNVCMRLAQLGVTFTSGWCELGIDGIAQVDNVFLGHTVLPEVAQVGNCTFLDTGGVFKKFDNGYKLSIVKLSDYC